MKYAKQNSNDSKKPKAQLFSETGKVKKKNAATTNGKIQKGAKLAAGILKEATTKCLNDSLIKGNVKDKRNKKSAKINSAQLGLLVDEYLEKKTHNDGGGRASLDKETQNDSRTGNDVSQRKKKKGMKTVSNEVNKSESPQLNNGVSQPSNVSKKQKGAKRNATGPISNMVVDDSLPDNEEITQKNKKATDSDEAKPSATSNISKKQRGIKRKATAPVSNMEVDDSVPVKENISQKNDDLVKKAKEMKKKASGVPSSDNPDYKLNHKDVLDAVNAALELHNKKSNSSKKLLDAEPEPIFLNFLFHYSHPKTKVMKFDLDHSFVSDSSDICLFVSDIAPTGEESLSKWKDLLKKNKVSRITEVIPLATLRKEYTQFVDKRKLASRFDVFLVESKVFSRVFSLVGNKFFHSKRKTPISVELSPVTMGKNIKAALTKTTAQYKAAADSFSIQIGHTAMKNTDIQENIFKIWEDYPKHFGVFWENIKRASLLLLNVPDLPLFCSLAAPEDSPRIFNNLIWAQGKGQPIVGELSSKLDQKVLVYPSGSVIVKSPPVPKKTEEEILAKRLALREKKRAKRRNKAKNVQSKEDEDSDDDIGGRADMLEFESDDDDEEMESDEDEEVNTKGKDTKYLKKSQQAVKGNKKKGSQKEDENSEESDVDRAEEEYMAALAAEKKFKSKPQKGKTVDVKPSSDSDNDSEADEDAENDGGSSDEMSFENDSSNEESLEDSDDEEKPQPKPLIGKKNKGKQQVQNPKIEALTGPPGKKFNKGNQNQSGGKKQNKKNLNQSPAQKSSLAQDSKIANEKKNQKLVLTANKKTKKQTNKNPFKGVKADKTGKIDKSKNNKLIVKKMK